MAVEEVHWIDYVVFGLTLAISAVIGIFYGCFGSRQKTTKEYLLANREMSPFPVALSLIFTSVQALNLIGNPAEVYLYGLYPVVAIFMFILLTIALFYFYIPVYFNLNVNSAYEFIEIRYNPAVRKFVSGLTAIYLIIGTSVAVYAPAVAINQVTGLSVNVGTLIIFFACIFYSTLGGLKAVLWTDVFQAGIMLISLAIFAGKGIADVGGFGEVWDRAKAGNRLQILNFDLDPRTRYTVWSVIIGSYFQWMPAYSSTQLQVQRFLSMPSMSKVKQALGMNFIGAFFTLGLLYFTGLVVYAKYWKCDPITNGEISSSDQLIPFFAQQMSSGIPGLLGLFIAGLTSAVMSSVSSGLSSLACIATYDYIGQLFPALTDSKLSLIAKISTFVLGMISYAFVFVIQNMGNVLPLFSSVLGTFLGPCMGIFSLGMMFPWANAEGAVAGMISAFFLMLSFVVGLNIHRNDLPDQRLPMDISGCASSNNSITSVPSTINHSWKDDEYSGLVKLLSVSYMYYAAMGCILAVFLGLVMSIIYDLIRRGGGTKRKLIDPRCISPPLLKFYKRFWPGAGNWIDLSGEHEKEIKL